MSLLRFAGWGAAGGLLLAAIFVLAVALIEDPAFLSNLLVLGPIFSAAGAGTAAGSLALARMAEDRPTTYSARITSAGSTLPTRQAGTYAARKAATHMANSADSRDSVSAGLTE